MIFSEEQTYHKYILDCLTFAMYELGVFKNCHRSLCGLHVGGAYSSDL